MLNMLFFSWGPGAEGLSAPGSSYPFLLLEDKNGRGRGFLRGTYSSKNSLSSTFFKLYL